jgi:argininosuccinate lyase
MVPGMRVNRDAMLEAAGRGYATATDLADYLVARNVPFRDAHAVVGRIVQFAIGAGRELSALTLEELRRFSDRIDADVFERLTVQGSVAARDHVGGTAPRQVRLAVARLRGVLQRPPR